MLLTCLSIRQHLLSCATSSGLPQSSECVSKLYAGLSEVFCDGCRQIHGCKARASIPTTACSLTAATSSLLVRPQGLGMPTESPGLLLVCLHACCRNKECEEQPLDLWPHCFQGALCQSLAHELHGLRASCWASLSPWWLICHCGVPSWQCTYASVHGILTLPWHQSTRLNNEVHMDTRRHHHLESHGTQVRCVASPLPEAVGYQVAIALDPCSGFLFLAGYVVLSICNLTLILILGLMDTDVAPKQPSNSAYSNAVPPHTQPTYPPRG